MHSPAAVSLLFDRTRATSNWEVGQVNELLTWLDRHPLPVVAATNHPGKLNGNPDNGCPPVPQDCKRHVPVGRS